MLKYFLLYISKRRVSDIQFMAAWLDPEPVVYGT